MCGTSRSSSTRTGTQAALQRGCELSTPIPDALWAELEALLHDREARLRLAVLNPSWSRNFASAFDGDGGDVGRRSGRTGGSANGVSVRDGGGRGGGGGVRGGVSVSGVSIC